MNKAAVAIFVIFLFFIHCSNQFWVALPQIGSHSVSATLPPWYRDNGLGLGNPILVSGQSRITDYVVGVIHRGKEYKE